MEKQISKTNHKRTFTPPNLLQNPSQTRHSIFCRHVITVVTIKYGIQDLLQGKGLQLSACAIQFCCNSTDHNPLNHISQGIHRYVREPRLDEKCLSGSLYGGCSTQFDRKNPIASGSQESSREPTTFCRSQYEKHKGGSVLTASIMI